MCLLSKNSAKSYTQADAKHIINILWPYMVETDLNFVFLKLPPLMLPAQPYYFFYLFLVPLEAIHYGQMSPAISLLLYKICVFCINYTVNI